MRLSLLICTIYSVMCSSSMLKAADIKLKEVCVAFQHVAGVSFTKKCNRRINYKYMFSIEILRHAIVKSELFSASSMSELIQRMSYVQEMLINSNLVTSVFAPDSISKLFEKLKDYQNDDSQPSSMPTETMARVGDFLMSFLTDLSKARCSRIQKTLLHLALDQSLPSYAQNPFQLFDHIFVVAEVYIFPILLTESAVILQSQSNCFRWMLQQLKIVTRIFLAPPATKANAQIFYNFLKQIYQGALHDDPQFLPKALQDFKEQIQTISPTDFDYILCSFSQFLLSEKAIKYQPVITKYLDLFCGKEEQGLDSLALGLKYLIKFYERPDIVPSDPNELHQLLIHTIFPSSQPCFSNYFEMTIERVLAIIRRETLDPRFIGMVLQDILSPPTSRSYTGPLAHFSKKHDPDLLDIVAEQSVLIGPWMSANSASLGPFLETFALDSFIIGKLMIEIAKVPQWELEIYIISRLAHYGFKPTDIDWILSMFDALF